jgi:Ca2+-binding RTX toxin-like protein
VGDGSDFISDVAGAGEINRLVFGAGITLADLSLLPTAFNVQLNIGSTGDVIRFGNFAFGIADIQLIQFADGSQTTLAAWLTLIDGTAGPDSLVGRGTPDMMRGFDGADFIRGGIGDDVIEGGLGNDDLRGEAGSDTYRFNLGDGIDHITDRAVAGEGNRILFGAGISVSDVAVTYGADAPLTITIGGGGDQILLSGFGSLAIPNQSLVVDTVEFSDGSQRLLTSFLQPAPATTQNDVLVGSQANDVLDGLAGDDVLDGSAGDDTLLGGVGFDYLIGGSGDDTLDGGIGVDSAQGGGGNDIYLIDDPLDVVTEAAGEGIDTVHSPIGFTFSANVENLVLLGSLAVGGRGNELNNSLTGNSSDNRLDGGLGNDTLIGGLGNDTYVVDRAQDMLVEFANEGTDTTEASDDYTLGANIENLTLTGSAAQGTGNDLNNHIIGNNSANLLDGGLGADRLVGGAGHDTFVVDNLGDVVEENPFGGIDLVLSAVGFVLGDETESLTLTGTAVINGIGNELSNVLTGNEAANVLSGSGGNDTLAGRAGNDTLRGGTGSDSYVFNLGDGIDSIDDVATLEEGNVLLFGEGITRASLSLAAGSVVIRVGAGGDEVHLLNSDLNNPTGTHAVEFFRFADGTSVTYQELIGTSSSNHTPIVTNPLADQTVPENSLFSIPVPANTFADQDASDVLTLSASLADGSVLPAWLSFDAATGTFTGTPDDAQVGSLDLKVTATDSGNLSVSDDFTLTVQNVNDAPTVAVPLADQQATEDAAFSLVVPAGTFADVDAGDVLTYSATLAGGASLPSWLSFDAATRTFSGTPLNSDVGNLTIEVNATDLGGLSATDTFALAIQNVNDAPTVANPIVDQAASTGTAFTFTVPADTFADIDPGDSLNYGATLANGSALPTWLSFNPDTRAFSGTPADGDAGILNLKVTATDAGNLSRSDLFDLTVMIPNLILTGTAGNDVLTGGAGNDQLFGLAGNDTLQSGPGHDLLDGGTGTDTMSGGTGNDTYIVDVSGDVVTELVNEGTDTVQTSLVAYTLGANVENLTLTGTGPSAGTGNALVNQLTGNSGANLLDGKAGADTMIGGGGDDLYVVDHVGDTVVELAGDGTLDSVTSSVSYSLSAHVEHLVLTGSSAINGTGNELDNVLTGNSAANVLTGLAGNDTYVIGTGDTVVEVAGGGTDTVVSGITHSLAANVDNLTLVGFSAASGTGNALDNILNGLLNLGGNTLTGGAGNDTYIIGGGDTVVEAAGGGTDTVQSLSTYTLGSNVENLTLTGTGAVNGTGNSLNNTITGNSTNNVLSGANGNDTLRGGFGNDTVNGGSGNDTILFGLGDGQDLVQDNSGTVDTLLYDAGINPLDLVISRQANDLRLAIHGSSDQITVQNWYVGTTNRTETIQAGNGQTLLSTQVDQLIQAMAGFTQQTGLTWDQAIDQQPTQVQSILTASWQ